MVTEPVMRVYVVYSAAPRQHRHICLELAQGAHVANAVTASGLLSTLAPDDIDALGLAVWGKKVSPHHILRDGDRVEILRSLTVDPKVARRERFAKQGAKSAGLFAKQRAGAKAGY